MKIKSIILVSIMMLLATSCGFMEVSMSFRGGNVTGETISIDFFQNKASSVQPNLSQVFTDELRDRFAGKTKLELVESDADQHLEGEIKTYSVRPVAIQGDETAAKNRLTIAVNVRYTNTINNTYDFESSFSSFEDFSSDQNLSDVEDELIQIISERLAEDIFNKAVVNW